MTVAAVSSHASHSMYVPVTPSAPHIPSPYSVYHTPSPRVRPSHHYFPTRPRPLPVTLLPTSSPKASRNRGSPRNGGYSFISEADSKRLISTLLASSNGFKQKRQEYVQQQRSSREGGKADVVNFGECMEVAGEKSKFFEQTVRRLGIFDEKIGEDTFVMYKKVPRTALQQKSKQPDCEEDVLTYLFSRWMNVVAESVKLVLQKTPDRTFKVWRSVKYMNNHGIYCEMFVISSEFNRHLFHREILV